VFADETRTIGTISTAITVLFAFFVGATAVGAEWRHGTLGALLLWEPRRMRVFAAKLGAMLGLTALVSTIGFATALGSGWLVSRVVGLTGTVGRAGVHAVVLQDLRGLALGAAAAACGFAVALTARRTAAALGVLMAYLAVGEIGVRGMSDESQGWLLSSRILAWTSENFTYYVDRCTIGDGCSRGAHLLGLSDGGSYLAVLTVVLLAVAAAIFRRREVT
jgi:ABC-2 type transport system permease protein